MRARGIATQSELLNTLLDDAVEKMVDRKALEAMAGKLSDEDFDDRLL
jgi:hypothetical protein